MRPFGFCWQAVTSRLGRAWGWEWRGCTFYFCPHQTGWWWWAGRCPLSRTPWAGKCLSILGLRALFLPWWVRGGLQPWPLRGWHSCHVRFINPGGNRQLLGPPDPYFLILWSPSITCGHPFFFNWSIVDLPCCVSFWCTAKWFSYTYIDILFHILFHHGLLQDIEYSSLFYTVGPCRLSILYIVVCIS